MENKYYCNLKRYDATTHWSPVKGYEGLYEISRDGEIKSVERFGTRGGIMKIRYNKSDGYYRLGLTKNNIQKQKSLHRLLAESFLPNPDNLPEVNHINGDKLDNSLNNLEWCTKQHNIQHAFRTGLNSGEKWSGLKSSVAKIVIDLKTGIFYYSIREAAMYNGFKMNTLYDKLTGVSINDTSLKFA